MEEQQEWAKTSVEADTQNFAIMVNKIFESKKKEFKAALERWEDAGAAYMSPEFFRRLLMTAADGNQKLFKCTRASLYRAALEIAQLQLEPNTPLQEAFLIPYREGPNMVCRVQIGKSGWVKLAMRTGRISAINGIPVYRGEKFSWQPNLRPEIVHEPAIELEDDPELIAAYAWADLADGNRVYEVLRKRDIERIRRFASSKSPAWRDFPDRMAVKSAIKRLIRTRIPVNEYFANKKSIDFQGHEDGPIIETYATEVEPDEPKIPTTTFSLISTLKNSVIDPETGEVVVLPKTEPEQPDGAEQEQLSSKKESNTDEKLSVAAFWKAIEAKNKFWDVDFTRKTIMDGLTMTYGEGVTLSSLGNEKRKEFLVGVEETMRQQSKGDKNEKDNIPY